VLKKPCYEDRVCMGSEIKGLFFKFVLCNYFQTNFTMKESFLNEGGSI
jgi:hypothetical protein